MTKEKAKELRSKFFKKCRTCDHYGPSFGCCLKKQIFTNGRGICDEWEALNTAEVQEYTEQELEEERFFEF